MCHWSNRIGLIDKSYVYIASDGVASTEDGDKRPIDAIKIFRKGPYIFGFAGSIRTGQHDYRRRSNRDTGSKFPHWM